MAVYIGYYRPNPQAMEEAGQRARGGDRGPAPQLVQLVRELPDKLPAGCKLLGSYAPMAGPVFSEQPPPGITVVETDNVADLQFISQHYAGYLVYHWVPATRVGVTAQEREAWASAIPAPPGALTY